MTRAAGAGLALAALLALAGCAAADGDADPGPAAPAAAATDRAEDGPAATVSALARLLAAYEAGARTRRPAAAARAQARYDCWVVALRRGDDARAAECRTAFAEAMQAIETQRLRTRVVLLADPDGKVGTAELRGRGGAYTLDRERAEVLADDDGVRTDTASADAVQRRFARALDALPQPPERYTLLFQLDSTRLAPGARATFDALVRDVRDRSFPEAFIAGHTDTLGPETINEPLSRDRAESIAERLVRETGLERAAIRIAYFGERAPAFATPDETSEARNRRVEISVR
jgi:outer membrane protein OmpA-like peptidoglycan-associated protein